jgi:hypothetical protein
MMRSQGKRFILRGLRYEHSALEIIRSDRRATGAVCFFGVHRGGAVRPELIVHEHPSRLRVRPPSLASSGAASGGERSFRALAARAPSRVVLQLPWGSAGPGGRHWQHRRPLSIGVPSAVEPRCQWRRRHCGATISRPIGRRWRASCGWGPLVPLP